MSSEYQQNGAHCMRLAQEANDAVLSFGYMKMAEAWLELDKRCRAKRRLRGRSHHTRSRRMNRRTLHAPYKTVKRNKKVA
jgi:hypothetical protein